jgi:hypothetical protein
MTYLAIAELVLIGVLVYLRDRERERNNDVILAINRQGMDERQQLITRIQHPQLIPAQSAPRPPVEPPHPNLSKIGTFAPREDDAA